VLNKRTCRNAGVGVYPDLKVTALMAPEHGQSLVIGELLLEEVLPRRIPELDPDVLFW